jgi:MYXO-CTERM domain-containing protein
VIYNYFILLYLRVMSTFEKMCGFSKMLLLCCSGVLFPALSHAVVLDWDTVDWTAGSLSQTFTNVQGSGMDIKITLSITGANFASWNNQTQPDDNNRLGGDDGNPYQAQGEGVDANGDPSEESLHLHMDSVQNDFRGYIDVKIEFSQAAAGVSFNLFDVDRGGDGDSTRTFEDVIGDVQGTRNGSQVAPTTASYDPAGITEDSRNGSPIYRGGYYSPDASNSVLGLGWNTQVVDSVSFRYYAGDLTNSTPGTQGISISDIEFYNAIPEAGTMTAGVLLLAGLCALELRRRRRVDESLK